MSRLTRFLPILWIALIATFWIVRGLPWNLDEYDQAKQAYTSYEMVERGSWWYQHTPRQDSATKPPLVGWISAGIYQLTQSWDIAWRLPSFFAALGILLLLWKSGHQLAGNFGAFLATAAFSWNLLSIRLATMVRTDMVLAFFIFGAGWLIWRRLQNEKPWTTLDTAKLTLLLAGATMTKGPIYHAFLLPGLAAWLFLAPPNPEKRRIALGYLIASLVSFVPFLIWTIVRVRQDPAFYDQVVVKEFLGRFTVGEQAVHNNQTWYFYLPHLLTKCLPWSLFFLVPLAFRQTRTLLKTHSATLWLVCWVLGGILAMSLVPSKRVDRIFPVVAPAALCLAAFYPLFAQRTHRIVLGLALLGIVGYGAYTIQIVQHGFKNADQRLVTFGDKAQKICRAEDWRFSIVEGRDEGLLMYADQLAFIDLKTAIKNLRDGSLQAVIIDSKNLSKLGSKAGKIEKILTVAHPSDTDYSYFLVHRAAQP